MCILKLKWMVEVKLDSVLPHLIVTIMLHNGQYRTMKFRLLIISIITIIILL